MPISAHLHTHVQSKAHLIFPFLVVMALSAPARAVDGCKVLLCMAGDWKHISQCEPTVRKALLDAGHGHPWPQCSMGDDSASANQSVRPESCPAQYRSTIPGGAYDKVVTSCPFTGVVQVVVAGEPWTRTWWSPSGDSVVEWLPAAKVAFASTPQAMDTRFDDDHAAWVVRERARLAAEAAADGSSKGGG